jgi:hypothetical protein
VVATLSVPGACVGDVAAAAAPTGNSAPVPAAKTTAVGHIRAFRPIRAATFPTSVI